MMAAFMICLSCGFREESEYTCGRICPDCERVRLICYGTKEVPEPEIKRDLGIVLSRMKPIKYLQGF